MTIRKQLDGLKKASLDLALQQIDESYNKIQEHNKTMPDRSGAFIGKEWFITLDGLITDHVSLITNFQNNIQRRM
jgi:hypothetical protein